MELVKLAGFGKNGFVQDVAEYDAPPESFNEVRNARFNSTGAVAFSGHRSVLSPAPISPTWLRVFPPVDRPLWVYADNNRVYAFDDGHLEITRLSGLYGGLSTERWQGEVLNGVGLFNNTVDVPQMWTEFSAATRLEDLTAWPSNLRCKALRPFKNYAIAMYLTESGIEQPFRVRWSHPADPGTVPPSWAIDDPTRDSGTFDIAETDDYIVDGMTLGEAFMVYKQKNAYLMYLTNNQRIFGSRLVIPGKGALTRDCVRPIPGGHFVAGLDDIYVHTGQKGSEQSVVEARVRNWIFNQIDASNFFNCFCVEYKRVNEVWFCFPEAGETYATIAMVYNTLTGGVGFRDLQSTPFIWPGPIDDRTDDGDIWGTDASIGGGALSAPRPTVAGTGFVSAFDIVGVGALSIALPTVAGTGTTTSNTDPEFGNVVVLLHGNDSDGVTTFDDSSSYNRTLSRTGSTQIDTAQSKFGGSSILVPPGGTLTYADAAELEMATGDWTVEFWHRHANGGVFSFLKDNSSSLFPFNLTTSSGTLVRFQAANTIGVTVANLNSLATLNFDTWYHIAVTREGSNFRLFIDGVLQETDVSSATLGDLSGNWNAASSGSNCWLEELRVTMGVARYTANFTPPSAQFPDA